VSVRSLIVFLQNASLEYGVHPRMRHIALAAHIEHVLIADPEVKPVILGRRARSRVRSRLLKQAAGLPALNVHHGTYQQPGNHHAQQSPSIHPGSFFLLSIRCHRIGRSAHLLMVALLAKRNAPR
jgi:hypothetical protein